ncbi:hypothetical protein NPIL_416271 [Nephila pilipes]|uniref:Uncharacterized protein n=1 Tax=Nephila pilipes TaxID=299642 RepID=A0A8X6J071_NEPPI|nr:hypothetical protein NPIL_416271 [Nephila pilipes]
MCLKGDPVGELEDISAIFLEVVDMDSEYDRVVVAGKRWDGFGVDLVKPFGDAEGRSLTVGSIWVPSGVLGV